MRDILKLLLIPMIALCVTGCDEDPDFVLEVPATYTFLRDGLSSVAYPGQTDRLLQLKEIKALMAQANTGTQINGQDLLDMYANTGGNGNGNFTFSSTRQLKDKTFDLDQTYYENLMNQMATASESGALNVAAIDGTAGLLTRGDNGNKILVNEKGQEFTQLIEKGIMGSVFYHQILDTYMTDERVGDAIDNDSIVDGENYTLMEHHWDEAFGYLGLPVDFSSDWPSDRNGEATFLGNYIREMDDIIGCSDILMNAFKTGRAAIVEDQYDIKNEQRNIIYSELEKAIAATSIHYINTCLAFIGDEGSYFHALSECYAFIRALKFSPMATLLDDEVTQLLKDISDADFNFWNSTQTGLNTAKSTISNKFGLDDVKNDL